MSLRFNLNIIQHEGDANTKANIKGPASAIDHFWHRPPCIATTIGYKESTWATMLA